VCVRLLPSGCSAVLRFTFASHCPLLAGNLHQSLLQSTVPDGLLRAFGGDGGGEWVLHPLNVRTRLKP
jgi:hypothetical protein